MGKILKYTLFVYLIFVAPVGFSGNALKIPLHAAKVTLDPTGVQDVSSLFVSRQINCQLVRSNGSIFTLEAAESVHFETPLKVIVRLKKSAIFHDGSPVTSDDVIESFNHIKMSRHVQRNIFIWVSNIYADGNDGVVIILKRPVPQFLNVLSSPNYGIFKKSFLLEASKNPDLWQKPTGCGGYKVLNSLDTHMMLTPIKEGRPIEFSFRKDNQITPGELNHYDISDLFVVGDVSNSAPFYKVEIFDPTQVYIGLNTKSKRWRQQSNRCQFLSMLHPDKVLASYGGIAKPAKSILPEGVIGYKPYDRKKNVLIKGVPKFDTKGKFCLSYLTVSIPEHYRSSFLNMINDIFPSVTTVNQISNKHYGSDFVKTGCDAIVLGLKANTLDGYDVLAVFSETYPNFSGYFDKSITKEIESSQNEANPARRASIYQDIVRHLNDKCLVYPVLTIPVKTVYIKKGLHAPNIGKGPLNEYYLGEVQ